MKSILSITDLTAGAGDTVLFSKLNITLEEGEMVAVSGPSGSGKTTLLRVVAGLSDPVSGTVKLQGRTGDETGWPLFRRKLVLVDQRPVLLEGTVEDNLRLPFTYGSAEERTYPREEAECLLESFGVSASRMEQEARTLSQGQQQRVCLVRAILLKPDVLLLDEPTSALDPEAVSSVEDTLVSETGRRGLAALVVTHDRAQAKRLCRRMIDLRDYGAGNGR